MAGHTPWSEIKHKSVKIDYPITVEGFGYTEFVSVEDFIDNYVQDEEAALQILKEMLSDTSPVVTEYWDNLDSKPEYIMKYTIADRHKPEVVRQLTEYQNAE